MRLQQLTMYNFMPYGGEHTLKFPAVDGKNVMVIFGANERGKTSLLNAIRWGFYGYAVGRGSRPIDLTKIVNRDSVDAGDYKVSVRLLFEANGSQYDLRREATARDNVVHPRNEGDFNVALSLRKDTQILSGEAIDHEINQLIPEQISRFFLFDGELLKEYEALVAEDRGQAQKIKRAIEQVLGVPSLVNGRDEIQTLLKQAQSVQAKENKHVKGVEATAEEQIRIQSEISRREGDLENLREELAVKKREVEEHDAYLSSREKALKAQGEIDEITANVRDLEKRQLALEEQKREVLSGAWMDLLQPRVQERSKQLQVQRKVLEQQLEERGSLKSQIERLAKTFETRECAICGDQLSDERRREIGEELGALEGQVAARESVVVEIGQVSEEINALGRLKSSGAAARVAAIEAEVSRNAVTITKKENRLAELEENIKGLDTAQAARVRSLRDRKLQLIGGMEQDVADEIETVEELNARANELSKVMAKSPHSRARRSNREVEIYSELEQVFQESVAVLRGRLKETVEKMATETFLRLTTDETYQGLRINENYGLLLIDHKGRIKDLRSSGAEQVVALALIDGLNKTARKTGPIVMDTPFGRLDPRHRMNILDELPRMGDQVILLAHEGELDREAGIRQLGDHLAAVYDIKYESSTQSSIEPAL